MMTKPHRWLAINSAHSECAQAALDTLDMLSPFPHLPSPKTTGHLLLSDPPLPLSPQWPKRDSLISYPPIARVHRMFNQPRPFRLYGIKLPLITSVSPSFSPTHLLF